MAALEAFAAAARDKPAPVLEATDLVQRFPVRVRGRTRYVQAVNGVSLTVRSGQCLGLVGESGCGKTTAGRLMVGLDDPTSGSILLKGQPVLSAGGRAAIATRRGIQMVFQDPSGSLDPRMTAAQSIAEPLRLSGVSRKETAMRVSALLARVGLDDEYGRRRPSALSGGQCQRIGIARALALNPSVIVADEPTSALDMSVRAQIINLLKDLQRELNIAMIFISHDLSTVRYLCDEVAVMYLGRVVEQGPTEQIFDSPAHPYTRALLDAVLAPDPAIEQTRRAAPLSGDLPDPTNPPSGCAFRTRCPLVFDRCSQERPHLIAAGPERLAACHLVAKPLS